MTTLTRESLAPLMPFEPWGGWLSGSWTVDDMKRIAVFRVERCGDPPSEAYKAVQEEIEARKAKKKAEKLERRNKWVNKKNPS